MSEVTVEPKTVEPKLETTKRALARFKKESASYGIDHARKALTRFLESGIQSLSRTPLSKEERLAVESDISLIKEILGV